MNLTVVRNYSEPETNQAGTNLQSLLQTLKNFTLQAAKLKCKTSFQVQARDTVERINGNHVDIEEFRDRYERQEKPVVIQGTMKHWQANEKWSLGRVLHLFD